MSQKNLSAAIIGGSLGGLFTAAALQQAGWRVDIYERSRESLADKGAGLRMQHDMAQRLTCAHIPLGPNAVSPRWQRYFGPGNSTVFEQPTSQLYTSWGALYRSLRHVIGDGHYHIGRGANSLKQLADGAAVGFEDGSTVRADIVIGADGLTSTMRQWVAPDAGPKYAGYVCWRGMLPEAQLSDLARGLFADAISYALLPHGHLAAYFVPGKDGSAKVGERALNFVWYRNLSPQALKALMVDRFGESRSWSLPAGFVKTQDIAELHQAATLQLPPAMAEFVVKTCEPFLQVVVDVEVDRMVAGHLCILGDAAFGGRPHLGAGTAKAAADAWTLAAQLASTSDLQTALARWESRQLAIGHRYAETNRALGRDLQVLGNLPPEKYAARSSWSSVLESALSEHALHASESS